MDLLLLAISDGAHHHLTTTTTTSSTMFEDEDMLSEKAASSSLTSMSSAATPASPGSMSWDEGEENARPPARTSKRPATFIGTTGQGDKWQACVRVNGKTHCLGTYDTEMEAAQRIAQHKRELSSSTGRRRHSSSSLLSQDMLYVPPSAAPSRNSSISRGTARKSRFIGVYATGNRWKAQIDIMGEKRYLGSFDNEVEAAKAFDAAARKNPLPAGKARKRQLNFPDLLMTAGESVVVEAKRLQIADA